MSTETKQLEARGNELVVGRFRVQVVKGADQGGARDSDGIEFLIGTDRGNHLVLTDAAVSRRHCVIEPRPHGFLLRDLGSTNGTFLGGVRVEAAYLPAGARIGVGETTLELVALDGNLREPLSSDDRYQRALGRSVAMRRIFALLPKIAQSDATVLVEGETGTGKTLLAEAIHQSGPRRAQPFVVVDCASIPANLIESELFGHEKGAFTGAIAARVGAFESAQGGTVFLDEVGELPLEQQAKLLRVLEAREVRRVGGRKEIRLDVRVIAATNRSLHQEVNRGGMRADLFYRLDTIRIHVPPLRERRDDIPLLAAHFYAQIRPDDPTPPVELIADLVHRDWPGNVRELRSAVERAVLLQELPPAAAPARAAEAFDPSLPFRAAKERAVAGWEAAYLKQLVQACAGNVSAAARLVRMDRNYLRELLVKHGLSSRDE